MAEGQDLVLLHFLVIAHVAQCVVGHIVAFLIHTVHVHVSLRHHLPTVIAEFQVARVVLLEESRANPVEPHHLTVGMLVEPELLGDFGNIQLT